MTRAEMRRKAKEFAKQNRTINYKTAQGDVARLSIKDVALLTKLKDEEVEKMKMDCMLEATDAAFILMLSMPLIVAKDWLGFGNKRLKEFYKRIMKTYACFNDGYVTLSELLQILYDETTFKTDFEVDEETLKKYDALMQKEKEVMAYEQRRN